MRSKQIVSAFIIVALTVSLMMPIMVSSEIIPYANPVFYEASVYISSQMQAEFTASTMILCSSISVSSCILQKMNGTRWINYSQLSVPSYVAINDSIYDDIKDYSNDIPAGGTYRLKVVFSGGGETVTRYSNSRSK